MQKKVHEKEKETEKGEQFEQSEASKDFAIHAPPANYLRQAFLEDDDEEHLSIAPQHFMSVQVSAAGNCTGRIKQTSP